jgi:hypothetical protein
LPARGIPANPAMPLQYVWIREGKGCITFLLYGRIHGIHRIG